MRGAHGQWAPPNCSCSWSNSNRKLPARVESWLALGGIGVATARNLLPARSCKATRCRAQAEFRKIRAAAPRKRNRLHRRARSPSNPGFVRGTAATLRPPVASRIASVIRDRRLVLIPPARRLSREPSTPMRTAQQRWTTNRCGIPSRHPNVEQRVVAILSAAAGAKAGFHVPGGLRG